MQVYIVRGPGHTVDYPAVVVCRTREDAEKWAERWSSPEFGGGEHRVESHAVLGPPPKGVDEE